MNTKQVLYDTLKIQLDSKKIECDQYDDNVYNPALTELKTEVNRWFADNVKSTYESFNFSENEVEIITNNTDSYDYRVRLRVGYGNNDKKLNIYYNSGHLILGNEKDINHIKFLSELSDKHSAIENLYENKWKARWNEINKDKMNHHESYWTLKNAMDTLSYEIKNDKIEEMKTVGFEIMSFTKVLNYTYDNELTESDKSIKIQYGRSQYDTTYITGFKVLGKKGNKYNIEIYRDGSPSRIYDILEKKFDNFVNEVCEWEYKEADKYNERSKKRYDERKKVA